MKYYHSLTAFIVITLFEVSSCNSCDTVAEPCYLYNTVEMPYLDTRHPDIVHSPETSDLKYCDLFALDIDIWYKSDYNMTIMPVGPQRCGSDEPIWLNGTIPEPSDGVVSREACVKTFSDDCGATYTVMIKHCYYYTVYCFPNVPSGCHKRFCFDVDLSAITTTTTTTTTTSTATTGTSPTVQTRIETCEIKICIFISCIITTVVCVILFGTGLTIFYYVKRVSAVSDSGGDKYKK